MFSQRQKYKTVFEPHTIGFTRVTSCLSDKLCELRSLGRCLRQFVGLCLGLPYFATINCTVHSVKCTVRSVDTWLTTFTIAPVSYTHLDVYKRQYMNSTET